MKKLALLLLITLAAPMAAQVPLTTITGTVHDYFGQPLREHPYTIKEMRRSWMIIPMTDFTDYTDTAGVLTFNVPRSNFSTFDTTKIRIYINAPRYNLNGDKGVWLIVPDAPTAELSTLPPALYLGPPGHAVLIPPQGGGYGDSIRMADSLARLALAEADTVRQDLLDAIAALNARIDTAGIATRVILYAQIAQLYDSLGTVVGLIADLSARVDTVGAFDRAANAARDAAQDISIAAAGKWNTYATGTYTTGVPKWMPDSSVFKMDNRGNSWQKGYIGTQKIMFPFSHDDSTANMTIEGDQDGLNVYANNNGYNHKLFKLYDDGYSTWWELYGKHRLGISFLRDGDDYDNYTEISSTDPFYFGHGSSTMAFGFGSWYPNSTLYLRGASAPNVFNVSKKGNVTIGPTSTYQNNTRYALNVLGNVYVHPDSMVYAKNIYPSNGTSISFGNADLWNVGDLRLKNGGIIYSANGTARSSLYHDGSDWNFISNNGSQTILTLSDDTYGSADSAITGGSATSKAGMHIHGGLKAEGRITGRKVATDTLTSNADTPGSPGYMRFGELRINGHSGSGGLTILSDGSFQSNSAYGGIGANSTGPYIYYDDAERLRFGSSTNSLAAGFSEKMTLTGAGRLGIGNINPATRLEVAGHIKLDSNIIMANDGTTSIRFPMPAYNYEYKLKAVANGIAFNHGMLNAAGADLLMLGWTGSVGRVDGTSGITFNPGSIIYSAAVNTFNGRIIVKSPSTNQYSGNFGGNVKVDSALFVKERIVTPKMEYDTTGYVATDSLYYWLDEVKHPRTVNARHSVVYPVRKRGYVKFTIPCDVAAYGANYAMVGMFQADSAADVAIQEIHQRGIGGRLNGAGWENYNAVIDEWVGVAATATVNWGSTAGTKCPRLRGTAVMPSPYTRQFSIMGTGGNAVDAYGTIEVEVHFTMPANNQSNWYVKIIDL